MTHVDPPRRILVCLDGSPLAETILPTVGALARRTGAALVLAHVVHVPLAIPKDGGMAIDEIVVAEKRDAARYLQTVAQRLGTDGITVATTVAVGASAPAIVACAEREDVDWIALATHGRSGPGRWLYGSVADAVLHTATRPVLLLRAGGDAAPALDVRRVVVALDGSDVAERALPSARALARRLAVPLVLFRAVDPMPPAFASDPLGGAAYGRILASLEAEAATYLAELAGREHAHGLTVETARATGSPADLIAGHGTTHPHDLLVLATHGRSGWRAALLGSVARRVLLLARGPLLLVRAAPPA